MKSICQAALLSTALISQAQAADLIEIYNLAQQADTNYQIAIAERDAAAELVPLAKARLRPNIGLTAETGFSRQDVHESANPFSTSTDGFSHAVTLSAQQSVYSHANWLELGKAGLQVAQAQSTLRIREQDLIVRVAQAYFANLSAQADLEFAQSEKRAIQRQLRQARERYNVGASAITDVNEARARRDLATAQVISAEAAIESANDTLLELTDQNINFLKGLSEAMPLTSPDPMNVDEWIAVANTSNPQLEIAALGTQIAKKSIDIAEAGFYPTISASASYRYSDQTDFEFGSASSDARVGLQLNVPIYQGGAVSAQTRQAAARHRASVAEGTRTRRNIAKQTRNAYRGVNTSIAQVSAFEQAVVSTKSALRATRAGYDAGTRTTVDVLNARRELFNSQRNARQARYNYVLQMMSLKSVVGTLSVNDLTEINNWLR